MAAATNDEGGATRSWAPSAAEYDDLALALDGILPTVSVQVPATLDVGLGSDLDLTDVEGTPVARLDVTGCRERAGDDPTRPDLVLSGPVEPLAPREDGVFRHLHKTPAEVAALLTDADRPAAVTVDSPLDAATLARLAERLRDYGNVVLLPLVGAASPRVVSAHALVRATTAAAALLPGSPLVVPVPLAHRDDPDDDAERRNLVASAYGEPVEVPLSVVQTAYPPTVAAIVEAEHPPPHQRGLVVFFTGLSGSGKSTLARRLRDDLLDLGTRTVTLLDGDVVRRMLSAGLGFSKADREANITRIGFVAAEVARHGGLAICAPIAPYAATRARVRQMVTEAGGRFVLVHVSTPLAECERRDRKGLYARARAGQIPAFTGISDPYEEPTDADLSIDTSHVDVDAATAKVMARLHSGGWLEPPRPVTPGESA